MYSPHHASLFLGLHKAPDTLRHKQHEAYGPQHTSLIGHITASVAKEKSVGRGAGGWCLGRQKAVAPEMDTLFVTDRVSNP